MCSVVFHIENWDRYSRLFIPIIFNKKIVTEGFAKFNFKYFLVELWKIHKNWGHFYFVRAFQWAINRSSTTKRSGDLVLTHRQTKRTERQTDRQTDGKLSLFNCAKDQLRSKELVGICVEIFSWFKYKDIQYTYICT